VEALHHDHDLTRPDNEDLHEGAAYSRMRRRVP
jgi:hypothetical protein